MARERKLRVAESAGGPELTTGEAQVTRQLRQHLLEDLWAELEGVAETGDLAAAGNLITSTTLDLDDQAHADVVRVLEETIDRTLEIAIASSERLRALPEHRRDARRTQLAILHYKRAAGAV